MSNEQTDELTETLSNLETQNCILIIKVCEFSNESIHTPGEAAVLSEYSVNNDYFGETFLLDLYANGVNSESKGFVSVLFQSAKPLLVPYYEYLELSCILGVVDASGNKRFLKSYVFPYHPNWHSDVRNLFATFNVDQFIKRETLLREPLDLLPDDCLTLHFDIDIKSIAAASRYDFSVDAVVQNSFAREESGDERQYYLHLDSELAVNLKEVSTYFQRMLETPMKEKTTRYMNIPAEEYPYFRDICFILMGTKSITIESVDYICQMYIIADKYDVPVGIENCRRLLISFLRAKNDQVIVKHVADRIPTIMELAEMYNDTYLKETIERVLKNKQEDFEKNSRTLDVQDNLEIEWKFEIAEKQPISYFTLSKHVRKDPEFDFYY